MEKGKESSGAVLYIRVSTGDQADPLNLSNQEAHCRDYCRQRGWPVVAVFTDPGQSARSVERPEFQRMLAFCRQNRRTVRYVIVQDLSRFARNNKDQAQTIAELFAIGVLLRSTYEGNIDETAAGKMAANLFGTLNQYHSDALSEKMKDRTRQAVQAGRFPWRAPVGFLNTGAKNGSNIRPDERRAPLIRRAFELVATGRYKKAEVLHVVTGEGLTGANGKPLTKQTFQAMLRNMLYAGWVNLPSEPGFEPVRGLHEPIVSQDIFDRVQAILDGRKPTTLAKRKVNPVVPLRGFVKCACCGTPLTGGSPQGRNGKKYPRYWCPNSECREVSLSKPQLETDFLEMMGRVRAKPEAIEDFPAVAARVWRDKQGDSDREMKRLQARIDEQSSLKTALFKMRMRGEITADDFEEQKASLAVEAYELQEQMGAVAETQATADSFLRFAELCRMDMAAVWSMAGPEERHRVQKLLFEDGLAYSPKEGILNRSNSSLFSVLQTMNSESGWLVGPPGLEPGTSGL